MRGLLRPSRLAILAACLLVFYTLGGFFLVPYLIKAYGIPTVGEKLSRPVLIQEVEVNPFKFSLRLRGFEIRERDQSALIGFEELFVDFEAVSLFRWAYVFDTIRLTMPYVSAKVHKDGRVNLAELVPEEEPAVPKGPGAPAEIPAIQIGHFEIARGIVEFRDESKPTPFTLDIVPLNIALNNFHTKPGGDNTYAFTAELDKGEILDWKGTIALEPVRSEGILALTGVKIHTFFQSVQHQFNFAVPNGTVEAQGRYRLNAGGSALELEVSDASVRLANIEVTEKSDPEPVITIPSLDIGGIYVDLSKRNVSIATVVMSGARDRAWRNSDGSINMQHLFKPVETGSSAAQPAAASSPEEPSWTVQVADVQVKNHSIHFEDRSLATTMQADVTEMSASTHDFTFPITKPIPVTVRHKVNETGTVAVDGQIIVKPFQLDLDVGLKNIAIQPFQPYFEKQANITVDSGAIDLNGKVHLAVEHPGAPLLTYKGNVAVKSLAIAGRERGLPLASWKQFSVKDLALAVDPTSVTIEELGLDEPVVHLALLPDGQLNLKSILPQPDPAVASSTPEAAPVVAKKVSGPSIAIKTVKLLRGSATFKDESITPTVQTGLYDLTGTIKGLSSKQVAKADVDLSGKVDKIAPLKVAGKINPLSEDAFTDLKVTLGGMDLTVESPYSGKYAGYRLSKGKLSLDLAYKVSKKQLEAENKVLVDQLTFGEQTDSPDATSLPVPLVVALLKDRQGRIEIDLPIQGSLDDPDFKYGKAVISTLLNLLTKIVASPFALMGKLIPGGGSEEDLKFVAFRAGESEVAGEEVKKLEALAKVLEERPGLRLDIAGAADPTVDGVAIRQNKLHAQLLAMRQMERGKEASNSDPLTAEDETRLVKQLYEQQFKPAENVVPPKPGATEPKPPTLQEMKLKLATAIPVDEAELRSLARARAEHARSHLIEVGKLSAERVFLLEVNPAASGHEMVRSELAVDAGS